MSVRVRWKVGGVEAETVYDLTHLVGDVDLRGHREGEPFVAWLVASVLNDGGTLTIGSKEEPRA